MQLCRAQRAYKLVIRLSNKQARAIRPGRVLPALVSVSTRPLFCKDTLSGFIAGALAWRGVGF